MANTTSRVVLQQSLASYLALRVRISHASECWGGANLNETLELVLLEK